MDRSISASDLFRQPTPVRQRPTYRSGNSIYNPEDYNESYDEIFDLAPGKYFVGDPSYVISELEPINGAYEDEIIEGIGRMIRFAAPDAGGVHEDEEGFPHDCPTGSLGVIQIDLLSPSDWRELRKHGRLLEFTEEFQVQLDSSGNIFLGWNWLFVGKEVPLEAERVA
jgi:hypothetical protein